jgi:hypothetical protein
VLVICLGIGGGAVYLVSARGGKTPTAGDSTGASATKPAADTVKLTAPDRIGTLEKMADQSEATSMLNEMQDAGFEHPFAVGYEDTVVKGRLAIAWGGTGKIFGLEGAPTQMDAFFREAGNGFGADVTVGTPASVDSGSAGGTTQCAPVTGLGVVMRLCAWAGSNALLGVLISGLAQDKADARMREMLQAIVSKG